jgi:very-short-patch-repair endonuclease
LKGCWPTFTPFSPCEARTAEAQEHDSSRTAHLEAHGYRVMRFTNPEVEADIEGVLGKIHTLLPLRGGD